ncbi:hypothetical protein QJQ45_015697, partial [Haematococcus lacustris]
ARVELFLQGSTVQQIMQAGRRPVKESTVFDSLVAAAAAGIQLPLEPLMQAFRLVGGPDHLSAADLQQALARISPDFNGWQRIWRVRALLETAPSTAAYVQIAMQGEQGGVTEEQTQSKKSRGKDKKRKDKKGAKDKKRHKKEQDKKDKKKEGKKSRHKCLSAAAGLAPAASCSSASHQRHQPPFQQASPSHSSTRSHDSRRSLRLVAHAQSGSAGRSSVVSPTPDLTTSPRKEAELTLEQYKEIYDRLISIFQQRPREDWKKLVVFSKQWPQHQQGVFARIKELTDKEADIDKKVALRKLQRSLQGVTEELNRYNTVLSKFATADPEEWPPLVTVHRGDLQRPFFEHVQCLMVVAKEDPEALEKLVAMNTRLVALCTNHDSVEKDTEKMAAAAEVYKDLLSSVGQSVVGRLGHWVCSVWLQINSVEDIDKKMEELGKQGKIDPAFLQISAKAYGAARDTNMSLDEAKWISYKLYRNAKDQFDRQQPAEKRILEYLMTIKDPAERRRQLDMAITPGPTRATETHDYMWSTPQRLYAVLDGTLRAYEDMRNAAQTRLSSSEASVTPLKIKIMREIRDELVRRYL